MNTDLTPKIQISKHFAIFSARSLLFCVSGVSGLVWLNGKGASHFPCLFFNSPESMIVSNCRSSIEFHVDVCFGEEGVVWFTEQSVKTTFSNMKIVVDWWFILGRPTWRMKGLLTLTWLLFFSSSNAIVSYNLLSQIGVLFKRRIKAANTLVLHIMSTGDVSS